MLFYKQLEPGGLFYTQTKTTVITFTGKVVVALLKNPEIGLEIAVFITTYGEDLEIIKATALAAKEMGVTHKTYILDDAKSESVKDLANQIGVEYITRDTNIGKKAGNINNALRLIKADFVTIFDADHIPKKEFLLKTLPFFHNSNLAFVQTPQNFRNRENLIAAGTADSQRMF
jgi:cellulose synthase (UDP-forming)